MPSCSHNCCRGHCYCLCHFVAITAAGVTVLAYAILLPLLLLGSLSLLMLSCCHYCCWGHCHCLCNLVAITSAWVTVLAYAILLPLVLLRHALSFLMPSWGHYCCWGHCPCLCHLVPITAADATVFSYAILLPLLLLGPQIYCTFSPVPNSMKLISAEMREPEKKANFKYASTILTISSVYIYIYIYSMMESDKRVIIDIVALEKEVYLYWQALDQLLVCRHCNIKCF